MDISAILKELNEKRSQDDSFGALKGLRNFSPVNQKALIDQILKVGKHNLFSFKRVEWNHPKSTFLLETEKLKSSINYELKLKAEIVENEYKNKLRRKYSRKSKLKLRLEGSLKKRKPIMDSNQGKSYLDSIASKKYFNSLDKDNYLINHKELGLKFPRTQEFRNYNKKLSRLGSTFDIDKGFTRIKQSFLDKNIVLVLGAGVSMECGVPDWNTLITSLFISQIGGNNISNELASLYLNLNNHQPAQIGRLLEGFYKNKNEFYNDIHSYLYQNFDESKLINSSLFKCILELLDSETKGINSIITYNFDDLIELYCERSGKSLIKSVYKNERFLNSNNIIPVYHVHGLVPINKNTIDYEQDITFSESIYHKQYAEVYNWNNLVQLNKFRDQTCIFIGSSLSDPNIRRLLDVAQNQHSSVANHFCLKKKPTQKDIISSLSNHYNQIHNLPKTGSNSAHLAKLKEDISTKAESLAFTEETMIERDLASLNVQVIWYEDHSEIPQKLQELLQIPK